MGAVQAHADAVAGIEKIWAILRTVDGRMKTCTRCNKSQPITEYGMNGRWRKTICKSCQRKYKREYIRDYEAAKVRKESADCIAFNKLYRAWPVIQ